MRRTAGTLLAVLLVVGLTACGGDDGGDGGSDGDAVVTTETTATTEGGEDGNEASDADGAAICGVIGDVQAELGDDGDPIAYQAQFVGRLSGLVSDLGPDSFQNLDATAQAECPEDHERFLEQAEIGSLNEL